MTKVYEDQCDLRRRRDDWKKDLEFWATLEICG